MQPNFARTNVPELKKYLQLWGISFANNHREGLLDLSVQAPELAIEIIDEQGEQMSISAKLVTDDKIAARRIFDSLLVFGRVAEHGLSSLI